MLSNGGSGGVGEMQKPPSGVKCEWLAMAAAVAGLVSGSRSISGGEAERRGDWCLVLWVTVAVGALARRAALLAPTCTPTGTPARYSRSTSESSSIDFLPNSSAPSSVLTSWSPCRHRNFGCWSPCFSPTKASHSGNNRGFLSKLSTYVLKSRIRFCP